MSLKNNLIFITCILCLIAGFIACGGGSNSQKILGKWQGDMELFKNDPEIEDNAFTKMLSQMIGNMKFEITKDTIKVEIEAMGKKTKEESKYKIVSETSDSVVIENTDGKEKGKRSTITIIDKDHIKITEDDNKQQPGLTFKRIK